MRGSVGDRVLAVPPDLRRKVLSPRRRVRAAAATWHPGSHANRQAELGQQQARAARYHGKKATQHSDGRCLSPVLVTPVRNIGSFPDPPLFLHLLVLQPLLERVNCLGGPPLKAW